MSISVKCRENSMVNRDRYCVSTGKFIVSIAIPNLRLIGVDLHGKEYVVTAGPLITVLGLLSSSFRFVSLFLNIRPVRVAGEG